jgi:hypothetical protein
LPKNLTLATVNNYLAKKFISDMKDWLHENSFLYSLFLSLSCFALTVMFFDLNYEEIDDFLMNATASGYIGGVPDEHLLYSNFLIGLILKGLYGLSSLVNWYGWYLCLTHIISWAAICYALVRLIGISFGTWTFLYLFAVFGVYFLQNLQFTTTATMATVAGFLLLFCGFQSSEFKLKVVFVGGALLVFAGMIRQEPMQLSLILLSPLFLILLKNFRRFIIAACLMAGIVFQVFLMGAANKAYYQNDPDWKTWYDQILMENFDENIALYKQVIDAPDKPYKSIDWSDNDMRLFENHFLDDSKTFSPEMIMKLKPFVRREEFNIPAFLNSSCIHFRNIHWVIIFFSLLIFIKGRNLFSIMSSFLLAMAAMAYIYYVLTMKDRVMFSILFCLCASGLFLLFRTKNSATQSFIRFPMVFKKYSFLLIILLSLAGLNTLKNQYIFNKTVIHHKRELLNKQLEILKREKFVYLPWGYLVHFDAAGPFSTQFSAGALPQILPVCDFTYSPLLESGYAQYGKTDLITAMPDKHFRFVSSIENNKGLPQFGLTIPLLTTYYKEHHNKNLKLGYEQNYPEAEIKVFSFDGFESVNSKLSSE